MPGSSGIGGRPTAVGPVLVGAIGLPWFADLDTAVGFERQFQGPGWPRSVIVEDLSYEAHRVLDRLLEIRPSHVVLVAERRAGDVPVGGVRRSVLDLTPPPDAEVHQRLFESVSLGVVDLSHTLAVARYWKALPQGTVVIEADTSALVASCPAGSRALVEEVLVLVHDAVVRRPSGVPR